MRTQCYSLCVGVLIIIVAIRLRFAINCPIDILVEIDLGEICSVDKVHDGD